MKKMFLISLLVALISSQGFGVGRAKYEPCALPYKQDRTIAEIGEILMRDGLYYDNLRIAYAEAFNALTSEKIEPTKKGMESMLKRSILIHGTFINPEEYQNGVKVGNQVEYVDLVGTPSDWWLAVTDEYRKVIGGYAKAACLNPQKRKIISSVSKKLTESIIVDTVRVKIVNKITYVDSIVHIEYVSRQEEPRQVIVEVRQDIYGYQPDYFYRPIFPIFFDFGYRGGSCFNNVVNNNYNYYNENNSYHTEIRRPQEQPHATGPGGRPAEESPHATGPGGRPADDGSGSGSGGRPADDGSGSGSGGRSAVSSSVRNNGRTLVSSRQSSVGYGGSRSGVSSSSRQSSIGYGGSSRQSSIGYGGSSRQSSIGYGGSSRQSSIGYSGSRGGGMSSPRQSSGYSGGRR